MQPPPDPDECAASLSRSATADPLDLSGKRPRSASRLLRAALGTMVAARAAPYGYTVSIWSSGAVLMRGHGTPSVGAVFGFVAGALTGFTALALLARGTLNRSESLDDAGDRVLAGMLHWLAVGAAVGAVAALAELPGWTAWPLGSFAAMTIYLLGASAQLTLVSAWRTRR